MDQDVALKELLPTMVHDQSLLKRLLTEARATMRLAHKQLVRIHSLFSEGRSYCPIMEYLGGVRLDYRPDARLLASAFEDGTMRLGGSRALLMVRRRCSGLTARPKKRTA